MINMESFAEWLQQELEARSWSRSEAAKRGGISASMFDKVINGYANPGIEFCAGVSRAFKIPADSIMRRAGILPPLPDVTPGLRELNFLYEQLDPQSQENILKMMRGYVREVQAGYAKKD